jgi:hypothetical protein
MDAHIGSPNRDNKRECGNKTIMDNWKWGCYKKFKSYIPVFGTTYSNSDDLN